MEDEKLFMTVKQAGEYLETTENTLYAYLRRGIIPKSAYIRLGNKILFIKKPLLDWVLSEQYKGNA